MRFFFKIKNRLFVTYTLYSFLITIILVGCFYIYAGKQMDENSTQVLIQTSDKLESKISGVLHQMDTTTLQVIANSQIRSILNESNEAHMFDNYYDYHYKRELSKTLVSINSPLSNNYRISIFDNRHSFFTIGTVDSDYQQCYNIINQYLPYLENKDRQYVVSPPHSDEWMKRYSPIVFSFVRVIPYIESSGIRLGYVEIQQPYDMLSNICGKDIRSDLDVVILDREQNIIYPYDDQFSENVKTALEVDRRSEMGTVAQTEDGDYFIQREVGDFGWTITMLQSKEAFSESKFTLGWSMLLFTLLFLFFSAITILWFTSKITTPINNLRNSVEQISNLDASIQLENGNYSDEIVMLKDAFNHMIHKLNIAMQESIAASREQLQAHMLAMQAQMNPHFLFNILMAVSSIADEHEDQQIVKICDKLSSMLRYVSSYRDSTVMLEKEVQHVNNYMDLMKVRYEEFLTYCCDIAPEALSVEVPKLIVQPIVENCFLHGFKNSLPPYRVGIRIEKKKNCLEIRVTDNGEGFTPQYIEDFKKKLELYKNQFDVNEYVHSTELGGLGLFNIYLRLRLRYQDGVQMQIGNNREKGSFVSIEIPIQEGTAHV